MNSQCAQKDFEKALRRFNKPPDPDLNLANLDLGESKTDFESFSGDKNLEESKEEERIDIILPEGNKYLNFKLKDFKGQLI